MKARPIVACACLPAFFFWPAEWALSLNALGVVLSVFGAALWELASSDGVPAYSLLGTSTTRTPWDALPELRDGTSSRLKNFIARRKPSSTACWCAVTRKMLKTSCRKNRTHD